MRIMVYGDSNSWGFPPDGSGVRFGNNIRWPGVMATQLGADLVEEALPGRTTTHDDAQMLGAVMNGLRHLPVALKSHSPLDVIVIMLGTNDFKARFSPSAQKVATNLQKLVECARQTGGGPGPWDDPAPPRVALIVPPPLPSGVDDPNWERAAEWAGGRAASLDLAAQVLRLGETLGVPVLDAGEIVAGSADDPIHLDAASHTILGKAVASWISGWS